MIYISSYCVKSNSIKKSIEILVENDIYNIELTGGTDHYPEFENDLLYLQDRHNLNYQVHNYFPPPQDHFILNLGSLNPDIFQSSLEHCKRAISLCKKLGTKKYGVHAGFLIDFHTDEAGNKIKLRELNDRKKAIERFKNAWNRLLDCANDEIDLYIENNVYSSTNKKTYGDKNPFLMTDYNGFMELKNEIDFNLLLDLAHLKVSAKSLGIDFKEEVNKMIELTDYLHISGNDGLHDQNQGINEDLDICQFLESHNLDNKTVTLEIYSGLDEIKKSMDIIKL